MKTLAVDANNDIYLGTDGALAMASDLIAVMPAAQQAAQTQLGEMIFAVDQGMPNFEAVWGGIPNVAQFEAALRRALLSVEGVTEIEDLVTTIADNRLSYQATVSTIYGQGALNG